MCRKLEQRGAKAVLVPRSHDYDLTDSDAVRRMFDDMRPDVIINLAGEVGGIGANAENPGRFFYTNMAMGLHLVEEARSSGVEKMVQVGTICSYPKITPVPFREEDLWNGYPEETNAPYGVAKKAILVMLQAYYEQYGFRSAYVMPVNLFGPGDNFEPRSSHVIPSLIRKCCEARESGAGHVECWGSGKVSRDFLYVDDAAEGIVLAAERLESPEPVNLGSGREITIHELATAIAGFCDFHGELRWDASKPDGQPRRCVDITRARELLGFEPRVSFEEGLRCTIDWWLETGR